MVTYIVGMPAILLCSIDALFNGNTFLLHTLYFIELSNMAVCIL